MLLSNLYNMLKSWRVLFADGDLATLHQALAKLQHMMQQPLRLLGQSQGFSHMWTSPEEATSSSGASPERAPSTRVRQMVTEAPDGSLSSPIDLLPALDVTPSSFGVFSSSDSVSTGLF